MKYFFYKLLIIYNCLQQKSFKTAAQKLYNKIEFGELF